MIAFGVNIGELFTLSLPVAEILIRGTAMYWFLFLLFRFAVRRDLGSLGIGDMLILVIVADAAQNAMAGEYKSIADGMLLVVTLVGWNMLLDWLSFRFPKFRRFAESPTLCLVRNGRMMRRAMHTEMLTEDDLMSKLRESGVDSLDKVKAAFMESDGKLSVIRRGD